MRASMNMCFRNQRASVLSPSHLSVDRPNIWWFIFSLSVGGKCHEWGFVSVYTKHNRSVWQYQRPRSLLDLSWLSKIAMSKISNLSMNSIRFLSNSHKFKRSEQLFKLVSYESYNSYRLILWDVWYLKTHSSHKNKCSHLRSGHSEPLIISVACQIRTFVESSALLHSITKLELKNTIKIS